MKKKFKFSRLDTFHFVLKRLQKYNIEIESSTIFEYGSTDIATIGNPSLDELSLFFDLYKIKNRDKYFNKLKKNRRLRTKDIWKELQVKDINGADGDGFECKAVDFNESIYPYFKRKFDIVLNLGTTEHVFNISKAFEDTHKLCKKNGIIVYALPVKGYLNHGYYSVNPKLISDIATFNKYKVLGVYKQIVYSETDQKFIKTKLEYDEFEYGSNIWDESNIVLFVFFKKQKNNDFKVPYENIASKIAAKKIYAKYYK